MAVVPRIVYAVPRVARPIPWVPCLDTPCTTVPVPPPPCTPSDHDADATDVILVFWLGLRPSRRHQFRPLCRSWP